MTSLTESNARQNGIDGNEVGTCFITSESFPDCNFLISIVDLPTPSEGFNYSFEISYANGWLSYIYQPDPNASPTELTTVVLPPYPCNNSALTDGTFTNVTVVDQARTTPKTGQVSNIQFQGKFGLPPHAPQVNIQQNDALVPTQPNWIINLFIIKSSTQDQAFGIVTSPVNQYLDGYGGPYSLTLSVALEVSGNVNVTPIKPTPPDVGIINGVAIGVATAPLHVVFGNWQVWPNGQVNNSGDVEGSYIGSTLSSDNPTVIL